MSCGRCGNRPAPISDEPHQDGRCPCRWVMRIGSSIPAILHSCLSSRFIAWLVYCGRTRLFFIGIALYFSRRLRVTSLISICTLSAVLMVVTSSWSALTSDQHRAWASENLRPEKQQKTHRAGCRCCCGTGLGRDESADLFLELILQHLLVGVDVVRPRPSPLKVHNGLYHPSEE